MAKKHVAIIYLGNGKRMQFKYDDALAKLTMINAPVINAAIVPYWQEVGDGTMHLTLGDYLDALSEKLDSSKASIIQTALALHAGKQTPNEKLERDISPPSAGKEIIMNDIIYTDEWRMTERQEKIVKEFGPCLSCEAAEIIVGLRISECNGCGTPVPLPPLAIGLFEGRHEMPVDGHMFSADETDQYGYHDELYKEAYRRGSEKTREGAAFEFYITGLTVAAIGVLDGCQSQHYRPPLMNFDRDTNDYVRIRTSPVMPDSF